MMPHFPPTSEIVALLLIENIFGWGFNMIVAWAQGNRIWHVSLSVVIGVTVTLLLPTALWWGYKMTIWQTMLLLFGCFGASGLPMIIGSTKRTVTKSHHRRPWPTSALKARDDAIMELSAIANEIAEKTKAGEIRVQDMADVVNRLHVVKGTLKSV